MKTLFMLLVMVCAAVLTACTSESIRTPATNNIAQNRGGTHHVITLHGVRGNVESYGEFHEFVAGVLQKIDPSIEVKTYNWTYPVGAAVEGDGFNWDPHSIGQKLNRDFFIGPKAQIPYLGPNDKISILAYSMGGMMTMTWYYDTMHNFLGPQKKYTAAEYETLKNVLSKVDNVIGLGPVFWGSVMAELGWGFIGQGDTSQLERTIPKLQAFCRLPEIASITSKVDLIKYAKSIQSGAEKSLPQATRQLNSINASVKAACNNINSLEKGGLGTAAILKALGAASGVIGMAAKNAKIGNLHPLEFDNMRPTSETIHLMRLGRIKHLSDESLRNRFKTRWTSIVGVFPCMQKTDKGVTCNGFTTPAYKQLNDGLVSVFAGVKRLEADGPVEGPNAVADFLYYVEPEGSEQKPITMNQFANTFDLEKKSSVNNQEIFVENMHATISPALMAAGGVGTDAAKAMTDFAEGLGVDVVIMNKECADPATCKHPNFKHVIQTLTKCEAGSNVNCDQDLVNKYFNVTNASARSTDSNLLRDELGTYILTLNVRVPLSYEMTQNDLNHIKKFMNDPSIKNVESDDSKLQSRVDTESDPFIHQVGRRSQFMSSFATIKKYKNSKEIRIVLMGRAYPKPGREAEARAILDAGIPLSFTLSLPGLYSRKITAKIKPTYTTYIDLYLKEDPSQVEEAPVFNWLGFGA